MQSDALVRLSAAMTTTHKFVPRRIYGDYLHGLLFSQTCSAAEKGIVIETGTHSSLLEEKGLYYAMWRQQIGERKSLHVA